tara:strand:+ start:219 stop:518 length:300 start_codon:yes stop_codon:yes gene_type:complete
MPYSKKELEANEHYTSLKERDEQKYSTGYGNVQVQWTNLGGQYFDSLRNSQGVVQLYETIDTGESMPEAHQSMYVDIYRRRYRTKADTTDIFDREFKEL